MAWSDAARAAAAEARRRNKKGGLHSEHDYRVSQGMLGKRPKVHISGARTATAKRLAKAFTPKPGSARALALQNKWMDNYQAQMRAAERLGPYKNRAYKPTKRG